MAEIYVQRKSASQFRVEVREGQTCTVHTVTANAGVIQRYGGAVPAEALIEKSFEFLLEREPKESILRTFDLSVIERYFPEFPHTIDRYLA